MDSNEDAVLCPVCYSVYDDPRSLPCGHSFCSKCISRVVDVQNQVSCPSCRSIVKLNYKGAHGLPKNYGLGYIIESHKKMSSKFCSDHKKSLDMFCQQCDVMICSKCLLSSHPGHRIVDIEDISNARKGTLTGLLESTKPWQAQIEKETDEIRSSRQSVQKTAETIKAEIRHKCRKWSDDLEKQRQSLQRHIDDETEQRMKVFDDRLTVLDNAHAEITDVENEIIATLSNDTASIVQLCGSVEERQKAVGMKAENVMGTSFAPPPNLEIGISAPWIEEAIQNIKPFEIFQGQTNSADECSISKILKENETLQKSVQALQWEIELHQCTIQDTERRAKHTSDQLKEAIRKNQELTDELEKEKRCHELKYAKLGSLIDKQKEQNIKACEEQFENLKMHLDDGKDFVSRMYGRRNRYLHSSASSTIIGTSVSTLIANLH